MHPSTSPYPNPHDSHPHFVSRGADETQARLLPRQFQHKFRQFLLATTTLERWGNICRRLQFNGNILAAGSDSASLLYKYYTILYGGGPEQQENTILAPRDAREAIDGFNSCLSLFSVRGIFFRSFE